MRRRLPAGGPVGAFLSGGLDSSLVVALARRLHDGPVHTYSVSFGAGVSRTSCLQLAGGRALPDRASRRRALARRRCCATSTTRSPARRSHRRSADGAQRPAVSRGRRARRRRRAQRRGRRPVLRRPQEPADAAGRAARRRRGRRRRDPLPRERSYLRAHQKCYDDLPAMLAPDVPGRDLPRTPLESAAGAATSTIRAGEPSSTKLMALNVTLQGRAPHPAQGGRAERAVRRRAALAAVRPRGRGAGVRDPAAAQAARLGREVPAETRRSRDLLPSAILERPKSGMLVPVEGWFQGPLLPRRARAAAGRPGAATGCSIARTSSGCSTAGCGGLRPRRGVKIWLLVTLEAWLRSVKRST